MASTSPSARTGAGGQSPPGTPAAAGDAWSRELAESVQVTRDGFEFHVRYRTRFGETKTDKLEKVLEMFQNMRAFKPHVNLQKSGIRLVVTRWDGETFVEEPGIENVEHASPEQVEELIRDHLAGSPERVRSDAGPARSHGPAPVIGIEVVRRPHEPRFHLKLHRQDGKMEDGPMLLRANMPKVAAEKWFRPGVTLSMSALSDAITLAHVVEGSAGKVQTETLPLRTDADAKNIEAVLNSFLRSPDEAPPAPLPTEEPPRSPMSDAPQQPPVSLEQSAPSVAEALPASPPVPAAPIKEEKEREVVPIPSPKAASVEPTPKEPQPSSPPRPSWMHEILRRAEEATPEQVMAGVFTALERRYERAATVNEHGFPSFTLEFAEKPGTVARIELVLTPHYLLCEFPFGYARFGTETRLFLNRTDDYLEGPGFALRGVAETHPPGGLIFVVSDTLGRFLASHSDRGYQAQFGDLLRGVGRLSLEERLLWPISREDELFELVATQAREYNLPVTADSVVLAPEAAEFIGFRKCAPHGIEFRDGEEFIRFSPTGVEWQEEGVRQQFEVFRVLSGWALDGDGRVCAICKLGSGFAPPAETKLVRFVSEEAIGHEESGLTILGLLGKW